MTMRTSLTALCFAAAAIGSSIDLYNLHQLPDEGFGGRGRHIASWSRHMAMAVGYTHDAADVHGAAAWPLITDSGPGPLVNLPTPADSLYSTAASYVQLVDGRYLIVGQWTEPSGMRRSSIWVNSTAAPLTYQGMALPQVPGSTGSEAHDILNLPNGGVAIVGHDWPIVNGVPVWIASVWRISTTGQITELLLPKPAGTGWSKAYSIAHELLLEDLVKIVGSVQETPNGPWRACTWRLNLSTGQATFRYIGKGQAESYAYRISPNGANAVGWLEDRDGTEFSAFWELRQSFPQTNLRREGRLYGIDDRGYFVGTQRHSNLMVDGLIGHVNYRETAFNFSSLVKDWGGLTLADHLWCRAADGQVTGCTTWGTSYLPIAGVPTGEHGFDDVTVRRGFNTKGDPVAHVLAKKDGEAADIRAQQNRVSLDGVILSAPVGFQGASLRIDLEIEGDNEVGGRVDVFNWQTGEYEQAAAPFAMRVNETVTNLSWATFPSSWRSPSGEIRFRINFLTDDRRDVVSVDRLTFTTQ